MPNQLRTDPTRTTALQKQFAADIRRRFKQIGTAIYELVVLDDAFGLVTSRPVQFQQTAQQAWRFQTDSGKIASYRRWLKQQVDAEILTQIGGTVDKPWTAEYLESAYIKGRNRAYTDFHSIELAAETPFYLGGKAQFLRDAFTSPISQKSLELLYTRSFTELEGVTAWMSQQMSRTLADGFAQGHGPRKIARDLRKSISSITKVRAMAIARTEIVRAYAEGQLDAFDQLGVEKVGVLAEWSTAGDDRVCPMCEPLEGVIMTVKEARGIIPRHVNCRCAWIPADKQMKEKGQIWTKTGQKKAVSKSIRAETPSSDSLKEAKGRSKWVGKEK